MAKYTWTGDIDNVWSRPDNWEQGKPPETDDDVVVPERRRRSPDPEGALVKSLTLHDAQLSSSMRVSDFFKWLGGDLIGGITLGHATMDVTGENEHHTRDEITVNSQATFTDVTVGLSSGAILTINGTIATAGLVRLAYTASRVPMLVCPGTLTVTSGSLTLDDLLSKFAGPVDIAPGAALVVKSKTDPTFLIEACRVRGGGILRVHAGGGLYAVNTARVEAGTTLELGEGGYLWGPQDIHKWTNVFGAVPGRQELVVDGQLRWVGGRTYADITLGSKAVLVLEGTDVHEQEGGVLRLGGSGAIRGGTKLSLRRGSWRVDGDLLLEGPLEVGQSDWILDNRGVLRVAGTGIVTLDSGTLDSRGRVDIEQGTLHVAHSFTLRQHATGSFNLSAGTTLSAYAQLTLPGVVTGFGQVATDLEAWGTLQPGSVTEHGTLTVTGALQVGTPTRTKIRIRDATSYSRVTSGGQVFLAGALEMRADGYTPAAGDSLDIVSGAAGSIIAGRFATATFLKPVDGKYVYLAYEGPTARLRSGTSTAGFDMAHPPAMKVLQSWVPASPYRWVGYYLQSPCHQRGSWNGLRPVLTGLGLGILVIYVGQQSPGTSPCNVNTTTSAQGVIDATDAIARATTEGFPAGTWIYLDIERSAVGGQPSEGMLAYIKAWVDHVLVDNTYNPGIYAHQIDVPALDPTVTSAFQNHQRADRARYWVVGGPAAGALTDAPWRSGVPEAVCWQQRLDFDEAWAGHTLRIDRSVSYLPDPSAP